MSLTDVMLMIQTWGPALGPSLVVLAFFLWKDWKRETRLQSRVEHLEKDHKEVILPMVEKCTSVIAMNTEVIRRFEEMFSRHLRTETASERCVLEQLLEDAEKHRQEAE